ncbi:MAG TPA: DUF6263 family protein [Candidatus Anammoximicrobium sp.]|mgnify:CR=1 FL=1|nr:DUF6263 family protein [Candidatus Anammoximicrobium sp.]
MKIAMGLWVLATFVLTTDPLAGEDAAASADSAKPAAGAEAGETTYQLRYKFTPGEVFRCDVTHLTTVETKIRGVAETAKTRSVSTKVWRISAVDPQGNITFTYTVEDASMWQQLSGQPEVRYDSTKDKEPPPGYEHVAESVGVPMATITIKPNGEILRREQARPQFNPGIGELTVLLPSHAVKIGESWSSEGELPIRLPAGTVKRIKTRHVYELKKVQTGVATVEARTEILTPVDDPAVQSQLVQRIKRGEIKFDVDAGRVLRQQMDIDETVIGFSGPDSMMKYLARLTEEMDAQSKVARTAGPAVK